MRFRGFRSALGWIVCSALAAGPASALTFAFDASQPGFPDPPTAVGTLEIGESLDDLIASDTGGFLVPLGVPVRAPTTLTDPTGGVETPTYTLSPRYSTTLEELLVEVELLAGNPAKLQLILGDPGGWRLCVRDPATCARRELFVSVPAGFGPGVAAGTTFDSDLPNHVVAVSLPEPAVGALMATGIALLAVSCRRTVGAPPSRSR